MMKVGGDPLHKIPVELDLSRISLAGVRLCADTDFGLSENSYLTGHGDNVHGLRVQIPHFVQQVLFLWGRGATHVIHIVAELNPTFHGTGTGSFSHSCRFIGPELPG